MKRIACTIVCSLAALLAGCASPMPSHFYTLSPSALPPAATSAGYSVSLGPVSVPDAVDRPQIVIRTGPNEVHIDEFNRWASPLKGDIARILTENLVSMLGTPKITIFPQTTAAEASYRAVIDVLRFESEPGRAATLDALWKVVSRKDGQSRSGRTTIAEPTQGANYAELVAAHSRALGRLSGEIAASIRELEGQKR
jgi:uncharacterized protein